MAQSVAHLGYIAGTLNMGVRLGFITDTNTAASNTVDAHITAVRAAAATRHAQDALLVEDVVQAMDWLRRSGRNSDVIQAPLTTAAQLVALTGVTAPPWIRRRHE
jgi:hypothetical protein